MFPISGVHCVRQKKGCIGPDLVGLYTGTAADFPRAVSMAVVPEGI